MAGKKKTTTTTRATTPADAGQTVRFKKAVSLLRSDDHDGPLVLVLWDRVENIGVGLDVANGEDDANELADSYMSLLTSRNYELRVVALSFDEDDDAAVAEATGDDDDDDDDDDDEDEDEDDRQNVLDFGDER